jgi:D-alanyl-lipoteichoic acid acyltransferase DltB (MBOAT superfamily)
VLLIATYSFAFQIYFDFSGYSDIARGLALLLGFELPFNFKEPYLSRDPSEFWRRWHITLSSWLRDYLYIPLGGNRRTSGRTAVNLMLTMLLGGLWHGASWTFVVWGGLHGLLLVACRSSSRRRRNEVQSAGASDWLRVLLMFHAACLLWIFFRAETFADAWSIVAAMGRGDFRSGWPMFQTLVVAFCCLLHPLERYARHRCHRWQEWIARAPWGPPMEGAAVGCLAAVCTAAASGGEFIYFQF